MKPTHALLTIVLLVAGTHVQPAKLYAQGQAQVQQPRDKVSKEPATASDQKPTNSTEDVAPVSEKTPTDAASATPGAPGEQTPQPVRGQGTVEGSRANPAPEGTLPGGRAGSGGHKTNEFGR